MLTPVLVLQRISAEAEVSTWMPPSAVIHSHILPCSDLLSRPMMFKA